MHVLVKFLIIVMWQHSTFPPIIRDIVTSAMEVFKMLSTLQPEISSGPDGISPRMLRLAAPNISGILCQIFTMSLCSGQIPIDWKSGNVVPLHRSGSVNDILNYRPIFLCSITCKTLEKIVVKNRLCQHISTLGLQSPTQHGFWEKRSCVTQVSPLFYH